mgnify:CR=1 FL=1
METIADKSEVATPGSASYRAVRSERLSGGWEVWADYPKPGGGTVPLKLCEYLTEANARLFAASPALLAVVKQAYRIFGGHTGKPGDPITGIEYEQRANMLDAMHALLARVRGSAVES